MEFLKNEFSTDWCLQASVTWGYGFDFFFCCCFGPRGTFWHTTVRTMHSSWTYQSHLCWQQNVWLYLPSVMVCVFILCSYFDYADAFQILLAWQWFAHSWQQSIIAISLFRFTGACDVLDAICMGSLVIIIISKNKLVN